MSEVPPNERNIASDRPAEASNETPPGEQPSAPASDAASRPSSPWGWRSAFEADVTPDDPLATRTQERWPTDAPAADVGTGPHVGLPPALETYEGGYVPPAQPSSARSAGRLVREIAETIILALLIFLMVRAVVQNFQVEGSSMDPTLHTGWYLLVNKATYYEINLETVHKFLPFIDVGDDSTRYVFGSPGRGDVIVFKQPQSPPGVERDFIKRIIGLPGEVVEMHDGKVFIDGKPLDEPYILEQANSTCSPQRVPPGHYYVLGDNRNNSSDSRAFGMVPKENIIGKAWLIYWPLSELGFVNNADVEPNDAQQQPVKTDVPLGAVGIKCSAA